MQNSYYDHPAEEALERFLLRQCPEEELELVETHVLVCGSCISRLEALEASIADLRLGFEQLRREHAAASTEKQHRSWRTWFTVPNMAWAGAAAVAVVGLAITPQLLHHQARAADISLVAYRGSETAVAPEGKRLLVHLDAAGLPGQSLAVELVDESGVQMMKGDSPVVNHQVQLTVPEITQSGGYFFRLYTVGSNNQPGELLREFALQIK